jgi:translation initiation factor IF-3
LTSVNLSGTIIQTSNSSGKGDISIDKNTRLNHQIRAQSLRVIDEDGQQLGILSKNEALKLAEEQGLDLVEISPNADPPVAKVVDWGKYNYQRTKQLQKSKKNAKSLEVKQMRFGLKIGEHDLGVKLRKVTDFLETGHKVKITVFYRGREMAHKDLGFKLAEKVIERFGDTIFVDQQPQLSGKQLSFVIRSNPSARLSHKKAETNEKADEIKAPSIKGIDKIEV